MACLDEGSIPSDSTKKDKLMFFEIGPFFFFEITFCLSYKIALNALSVLVFQTSICPLGSNFGVLSRFTLEVI